MKRTPNVSESELGKGGRRRDGGGGNYKKNGMGRRKKKKARYKINAIEECSCYRKLNGAVLAFQSRCWSTWYQRGLAHRSRLRNRWGEAVVVLWCKEVSVVVLDVDG